MSKKRCRDCRGVELMLIDWEYKLRCKKKDEIVEPGHAVCGDFYDNYEYSSRPPMHNPFINYAGKSRRAFVPVPEEYI